MIEPIFSSQWYATFLDSIPGPTTAREVDFIQRQLPLSTHREILDVCCGPARHAALLAERGYDVHGIDLNEAAIARARELAPAARFDVLDMRRLAAIEPRFDGVINLWASFGYFDDATNRDILRQVHGRLRPGGRAIFDIYNRDHYLKLPAFDSSERDGVRIETSRSWSGPRMRVTLRYASGGGDRFEWRLFTPAEFEAECSSVGLETVLACAWFDEASAPSAEHARMQFVVQRSS